MAMDYDIQQHELVALNPAHDLSLLDMAALTLIATHPCPTLPPQTTPPSPKRPFPPDMTAPPSKKRPCTTCFHCGGSGHLPGDCHADSTVAGQQASVGEVQSGPVRGHFCQTGDRTVRSQTKFLGPGPGPPGTVWTRSGPGPDRYRWSVVVPGPGPKNFVRDRTVRSPVWQKWPGTGPDRTSPTLEGLSFT